MQLQGSWVQCPPLEPFLALSALFLALFLALLAVQILKNTEQIAHKNFAQNLLNRNSPPQSTPLRYVALSVSMPDGCSVFAGLVAHT